MNKTFNDVTFAAEFLHTVQPFNSLAGEDLQELARKLEANYYPQGKAIFASRPSPGLAIIRKGAARLLDKDHKFLDKRSEGEIFGHDIYFHGELKDYFAEAEEDCLLWHLDAGDFDQLCKKHPLIGEYFSSHLMSRLSAAIQVKHTVTQVKDLLNREPVLVDSEVSIREAAQEMSAENVSSILVVQDGELCGIVTDKDLRQRVLVEGLDSGLSIKNVMTTNPMSIPGETITTCRLLTDSNRSAW